MEAVKLSSDEMDHKNQEIDKDSQLVSLFISENEKLKVGLSTIQNNIAEAVNANNQTIESNQSTAEKFHNILSGINLLNEKSTHLNDFLKTVEKKVDQLTTSINEIQGFSKAIQGIADQTNLLALNATIESARAGDAGRGFAVVANEVKELSRQTSSLTENINKSVSTLVTESKEINTIVQEATQGSSDISDKTSQFVMEISDAIEDTNVSSGRVRRVNDRIFITLAKLDHVIWKVNTYLSVAKKKEEFKFVDYHNCRLGKWYYEGEGNKNFSHLSSYQNLEMPHAKVHLGTKSVFDNLKNGDINYNEIKVSIDEMEEGSQGVFEVLDRILSEKHQSY